MDPVDELLRFLDSAPTARHAAVSIARALEGSGFHRLREEDSWELTPGKPYFVMRNESAVIAFRPGTASPSTTGYRIAAAHLDSPLLKLKEAGIVRAAGAWRLPVETYGSPILRTWLDRELEIAGGIAIQGAGDRTEVVPWRSGKPWAVVPSVAIHLDKEVNQGGKLDPQTHMAALLSGPAGSSAASDGDTDADTVSVAAADPAGRKPLPGFLLETIAENLGIDADSVLSVDLYLVPFQPAVRLGGEDDLIASGRLDDLAMSHAILHSFTATTPEDEATPVAVWFDAEEIGSRTPSGASSPFFDEILERISLSRENRRDASRESYFRARRRSILLSADMVHAIHPNYSDRHDPAYAPVMGKGPVLKAHGQRRYITEVETEAAFLRWATRAGVETQKFVNRSDLPCGSTIGPLASAATGISALDLGNPLWGMHSARETASGTDHRNMVTVLSEFWKG